ncbi:uncharacterized protein [Diabrotica undecimpunctata]|uniref:uncharacterized protein n=1 Tax=Diabrotica undecimpunctata TaxID=50387 RepID=UPI003B6415F5
MDEEKLIILVSGYKELYDLGDKNYSNQERKNNCWNEISDHMKQPILVSDCKERWTRLRDNYRKALKFRKGKSGDAATKLKPYKFEKEMAFLKPFMQDREQKSNLVEIASIFNSSDPVYEDEEGNDHIEDSDNVSESTESRELTPTLSTGTTIRRRTATFIPRKRKHTQIMQPTNSVASVLEKYLESTAAANASSGGNSLRQFFIAMADTTQSFQPALQIEVKSKIFNIVQQAELKCLQVTVS